MLFLRRQMVAVSAGRKGAGQSGAGQDRCLLSWAFFSRRRTATARRPQRLPPCKTRSQVIARQKGVSPESLTGLRAKAITPFTVRLPAYGPDGKQCTHFDLSVRGGKGKFAYGKPAGLFFPHEGGKRPPAAARRNMASRRGA